jgi:hypothetical protein
MSPLHGRQFLGEWDVTELVYSPDAELLGTVRQLRRLEADHPSGSVLVHQRCEPSRELARHPMAAFSGDFSFRLDISGRQRLYRGPDVQGSGTAFGGTFLCGQGVWPRFGYNFRSWSISLGDTQQLTGGVFFRGSRQVAVIVGVGSLRGTDAGTPALDASPCRASAAGSRWVLDLESGEETHGAVTRQAQDPTTWLEWGESSEDHFELRGGDGEYVMTRNQGAVGMAKAYGPLLCWELHGHHGDSVIGLDIGTQDGEQQFSLRQNVHNGRLISLEGIRLTV